MRRRSPKWKPKIIFLNNKSRKGEYVYFRSGGRSYYYRRVKGVPLSHYKNLPGRRRGGPPFSGRIRTFKRGSKEYIVLGDGRSVSTFLKSPYVSDESYMKAYKSLKKGYINRSDVQAYAKAIETKGSKRGVELPSRSKNVLERARKSKTLASLFDFEKKVLSFVVSDLLSRSPRAFYENTFDQVVKDNKKKFVELAVSNHEKLNRNFTYEVVFYSNGEPAVTHKFNGIPYRLLQKYARHILEKASQGKLISNDFAWKNINSPYSKYTVITKKHVDSLKKLNKTSISVSVKVDYVNRM